MPLFSHHPASLWLHKLVTRWDSFHPLPSGHLLDANHFHTMRFLRYLLRLLLLLVPTTGILLLISRPYGWQSGVVGITAASLLYWVNLRWLTRRPSPRWGIINLVVSVVVAVWLPILFYEEYPLPALLWLVVLPWFSIMVAGYKSGLLITLFTACSFLLYHSRSVAILPIGRAGHKYILVPADSFMVSFVIFLVFSSLLVVLLDVSRRRFERELIASEQKRRLYIQQTSVAVIDCDIHSEITGWNEAAQRMFGYTPAEALGHHLINLLAAPDAAPQLRALADQIRQKQITEVRDIYRNQTKAGRTITCEWTTTGIWTEAGAFIGFICCAVDITARIESERELKLAKEQAEAATRAKSAFLANMSHEIRTPMNGVIGMTNLLLATPLNPEQSEYVETIHRGGNALLEIINEILDFSKIESGKLTLDLQAFDLTRTLEDLVNLLAPKPGGEIMLDLQIDAVVPRWLVGDAGRLRQILINLVGNALKFTEQGAVTLCVEVQAASEQWVELCFAVRDTGIGIALADIPGLFERFVQADGSTTRKYGGTGLGLSICKLLVEKMEGRIWVESEVARGSTFYVVLRFPRAEPRTLPLRTAPLATARHRTLLTPSAPLSILLVEDNPINQKVALRILAHIGYQAELASNGRAAVEAVQQQSFDLVLMDLQMPELDGFAATRQIRRMVPRQRQPYIIAMTAAALAEDQRQALAAGMDDFIAKPIRPEALAQKLATVPRLPIPSRQPIRLHERTLPTHHDIIVAGG